MNKLLLSLCTVLLMSGLIYGSNAMAAISGIHCTYQDQSAGNIAFCKSHQASATGSGKCKVQPVYKTSANLPGWKYDAAKKSCHWKKK